jgi:DNA invertase Pin-like site-specific DNA recombinase
VYCGTTRYVSANVRRKECHGQNRGSAGDGQETIRQLPAGFDRPAGPLRLGPAGAAQSRCGLPERRAVGPGPEFVEVESGKRDDRPKLAEALALCRLHNATLMIAKLDRLSRDAAFLLGLQKASVRFVAADMPEANELVVGIMAVVAQAERKMISARTRAALAAAKARGVQLGKPENLRNQDVGRVQGRAKRTIVAGDRAADLRPIVADLQADGASSLRQISAGLNQRGIPTARGGAWSAVQVKRLLERVWLDKRYVRMAARGGARPI